MFSEELKIILAIVPAWTISIDGKDFVSCSSRDIEVSEAAIRFGPHSRRILAVEWLRHDTVRIRARSRLRTGVEVLTFYPGSVLPAGIELRRRRRLFQRQLAPALARYFGDCSSICEMLKTDRKRGIGSAYPRFVIGRQPVIAVDPDESTPVVHGIMRAALQYADHTHTRIAVVIPTGRRTTLALRLRAMPSMRERFEWLQWNGTDLSPLDLQVDQLETRVHPFRMLGLDQQVARVQASSPAALQVVPDIAGRAVSLRFRGLEVAHVTRTETIFPLGEPLDSVIRQLSLERRHDSNHPLARAHEERWLESNLIERMRTLFPVQPEHVYPQVPSFTEQDRKIVDLLTITDRGRLIVMEVKVSPDPDLPFQAFDYWLAVEKHRKAGDFQPNGYFAGIDIQDQPAILAIVAPLLGFHKLTDRLMSMLPDTVPLVQIGINQSWKQDIQILRRRSRSGSLEVEITP